MHIILNPNNDQIYWPSREVDLVEKLRRIELERTYRSKLGLTNPLSAHVNPTLGLNLIDRGLLFNLYK